MDTLGIIGFVFCNAKYKDISVIQYINEIMTEDEPLDTGEEILTDELTDLAFGMFTLFMEQQLQRQGTCLSRAAEEGRDLTECCESLLPTFTGEYPPLAGPLALLGSGADIAALYRAGEGIVPTKTTRSYWIQQGCFGAAPDAAGAEEAGKWLIFLPPGDVDSAWQKIRDATVSGTLGIGAKVSTAKENEDSRDERKVIYVFTADWSDEPDVMRVREALKQLGFVDRIGYKRNIDTYAGEYREKGKRVTYYSV